MGASRAWCIIVTIAACACGARTECGKTAQISFLTSVHDDPSCTKLSAKGVTLYEAANLLAEIHNNKTDGYEIGITVLDTCGSITGSLKAVMKALVWANINCLHPPHYLGIIGPDVATNIEAVHKVTSVLKVPHIVKKRSVSPYLHPLPKESNSYIVRAILRTIETLKWNSFALAVNVNDENDDVQNIAKKLTMSAIEKNLCIVIRDNDEEDYTSRIVHIGKPERKFFDETANATVLIISKGNLRDYLNRIDSTNTILLLEDSRNVIDGLEWRVENSPLWAPESGLGKYDAEQSGQIKWIEDAIRIYTRALRVICRSKRCKNEINPVDWNHVVSNVIAAHDAESRDAPRRLVLSMKAKTSSLERLGGVIVRKNKTKIYWGESKSHVEEESDEGETASAGDTADGSDEGMPFAFRGLLDRKGERRTGCATTVREIKMLRGKDDEAARVLVSDMDDTEWWTMVWTVSGVGVAMFLLGIFAVYVIYTNIRGPRCSKDEDHLDRDTSLRRMGSDRELPATITVRNQRVPRTPQRTGSDRSYMSEKSV